MYYVVGFLQLYATSPTYCSSTNEYFNFRKNVSLFQVCPERIEVIDVVVWDIDDVEKTKTILRRMENSRVIFRTGIYIRWK